MTTASQATTATARAKPLCGSVWLSSCHASQTHRRRRRRGGGGEAHYNSPADGNCWAKSQTSTVESAEGLPERGRLPDSCLPEGATFYFSDYATAWAALGGGLRQATGLVNSSRRPQADPFSPLRDRGLTLPNRRAAGPCASIHWSTRHANKGNGSIVTTGHAVSRLRAGADSRQRGQGSLGGSWRGAVGVARSHRVSRWRVEVVQRRSSFVPDGDTASVGKRPSDGACDNAAVLDLEGHSPSCQNRRPHK